ncbi:hypothetical protein [Alkalihalobacterium sp. APHAB7]|uniref:hypothetical protein n=1 Tax=Alkalihalobacterium sp. APHAB7 TaxID=3402081 RepID=UPI003AAF89FC
MNNYIETIKENFMKVYDIKTTAATNMRHFHVLPYQEQRAAINANPVIYLVKGNSASY